MIDAILTIIFEFIQTAFLALSPARIVRKLVYKIPINVQPDTTLKKVKLYLLDFFCWIAIAFVCVFFIG